MHTQFAGRALLQLQKSRSAFWATLWSYYTVLPSGFTRETIRSRLSETEMEAGKPASCRMTLFVQKKKKPAPRDFTGCQEYRLDFCVLNEFLNIEL